MEIKVLVECSFTELEEELERALDGLTPEELTWQPDPEANAVGFNFWHLSRAEDGWVNGFALHSLHVSTRDGWAARWGIPEKDSGFGYTASQLAAFPTPPLAELWEYHRAVRKQTNEYLKSLTPEDFDRQPPPGSEFQKGYTVGRMFAHLFSEIGQHLGHIFYVRGLQRGMDK